MTQDVAKEYYRDLEDDRSEAVLADPPEMVGQENGPGNTVVDEKIDDIVPFASMEVVRGIGAGVKTVKSDSDAREVTMSEQEKELLKWIAVYCLRSIISPQVFDENMSSNKPLFEWGIGDDMAFGILAVENYLNKWIAMARVEVRDGKLLTKTEIKKLEAKVKYNKGNGLSTKEGQKRYMQLRNYVARLSKDDEKKELLEKEFLEYYDQVYRERNEMQPSPASSTRSRRDEEEVVDELSDDLENTMMNKLIAKL